MAGAWWARENERDRWERGWRGWLAVELGRTVVLSGGESRCCARPSEVCSLGTPGSLLCLMGPPPPPDGYSLLPAETGHGSHTKSGRGQLGKVGGDSSFGPTERKGLVTGWWQRTLFSERGVLVEAWAAEGRKGSLLG